MKLMISDRIRHFFHVLSNIRPLVWVALYLLFIPLFAAVYWALPGGEFRIPDGGAVNYWSWLYYSIVTITTLGFGDYTPAMGWAQAFTAIEVGCGILTSGLFLNAVGAMKSEIDVASEVERQRLRHLAVERGKLVRVAPLLVRQLNLFLSCCYAVTIPRGARKDRSADKLVIADVQNLYKPSVVGGEHSGRTALKALLDCADRTALSLDSLQTHVDLSLWPDILEDCFTFVADTNLFNTADHLRADEKTGITPDSGLVKELEKYIRTAAAAAGRMEAALSKFSLPQRQPDAAGV